MHGKALLAIGLMLLVVVGCKAPDSDKKAAAKKAAAMWYDGVAGGTYKGGVGGNNDPITFKFAMQSGQLVATYSIDDKAFADKPYNGKLLKAKAVEGKERTLNFRYEDDMNSGYYVVTFSKDLKTLTGTYIIDGEGESDANTVTATRL